MHAAHQLINAELERLQEQKKRLNTMAGQTQSNEIRKAYVASASALEQSIRELANAERVLTMTKAIVDSDVPLKPMLRDTINAVFPDWNEQTQLTARQGVTKHLLDVGYACLLSREGKTVEPGLNLPLKDWVKTRNAECLKAEDAVTITPRAAIERIPDPQPVAEEVETDEDRLFQQKAEAAHAAFLDDEVFEQKRDQDI